MATGISFKTKEEADDFAQMKAESGLYPVIINKGKSYQVRFFDTPEKLEKAIKKLQRQGYKL